MGVRLNGSTSGYVELTAPAVAGTTTLELPTDSIKPGLVLVTTQSFSAASSVSVNNCFSSSYDNYCVLFSADINAEYKVRMRAGGTDNTAASYKYGGTYFGGVNGSFGSSTDNGWPVLNGGPDVCARLEFLFPFLAAKTKFLSTASETTVGKNLSGTHDVSASYDGFTIALTSGTATGSLYVYGYRKA